MKFFNNMTVIDAAINMGGAAMFGFVIHQMSKPIPKLTEKQAFEVKVQERMMKNSSSYVFFKSGNAIEQHMATHYVKSTNPNAEKQARYELLVERGKEQFAELQKEVTRANSNTPKP